MAGRPLADPQHLARAERRPGPACPRSRRRLAHTDPDRVSFAARAADPARWHAPARRPARRSPACRSCSRQHPSKRPAPRRAPGWRGRRRVDMSTAQADAVALRLRRDVDHLHRLDLVSYGYLPRAVGACQCRNGDDRRKRDQRDADRSEWCEHGAASWYRIGREPVNLGTGGRRLAPGGELRITPRGYSGAGPTAVE